MALACWRHYARKGLTPEVIVVSGDVQDEAVRRAKALGARAFIKKPADPMQLAEALNTLGVDVPMATAPTAEEDVYRTLPNVSFRDAFREVSNVAMGRAAELLAPRCWVCSSNCRSPNVNILEVGELHMALADAPARRPAVRHSAKAILVEVLPARHC